MFYVNSRVLRILLILGFECRMYYKRVEEGKQYPVLCRRLLALNDEFMSYKSPSAGFDFRSGRKIEQKIVDYNVEAERFGGSDFRVCVCVCVFGV